MINQSDSKKCSGPCGLVKPISEFRERIIYAKLKTGEIKTYDTRDNLCDPCRKAYHKEYRIRKQREKVTAPKPPKPKPAGRQKMEMIPPPYPREAPKPKPRTQEKMKPVHEWKMPDLQRESVQRAANTHIARPGSRYHLTQAEKLALAQLAAEKWKRTRRVG